jgi:hypothetical protein
VNYLFLATTLCSGEGVEAVKYDIDEEK